MSLNQVKWFEPAVQVESLRRAALAKPVDTIKTVVVGYSNEAENPFVPLFKQMIDHLANIQGTLQSILASQGQEPEDIGGMKARWDAQKAKLILIFALVWGVWMPIRGANYRRVEKFQLGKVTNRRVRVGGRPGPVDVTR